MMRAPEHSTAVEDSLPTPHIEIVPMAVDFNHPLLQLKRELPWDRITEVMVSRWRAAGKNVDGKPGQPWDVLLYVPLLVLMLLKALDSRKMEEYLAENVVARLFISRQDDHTIRIRDHSSIARALQALGAEGVEEVNRLIVKEAVHHGYGDAGRLSADTTTQELAIGYPHEAGILRGIAQRCQRALRRLKKTGVVSVEVAIERSQQVLRSVKEYHLFAKVKEEKDRLLTRLVEETQELIQEATKVVQSIGPSGERVQHSAVKKLQRMKEVAAELIPQIVQWLETGKVAKNKILHATATQARAIVRHKVGKRVEFGLRYLINRIGGGYVFGSIVRSTLGESQMPLVSLQCYRKIFGVHATPQMMVYDRGGHAQPTIEKLSKQGVEKIGIQPKGKAQWSVAEADRQVVKSERGKMEGSIGTLKTEKYGFNKPPERLWEMLQLAGQRSMLASNLNKLMRDISRSKESVRMVQG